MQLSTSAADAGRRGVCGVARVCSGRPARSNQVVLAPLQGGRMIGASRPAPFLSGLPTVAVVSESDLLEK